MDGEVTREQEYNEWLDSEAKRLCTDVKRRIQSIGMDSIDLLSLLDWCEQDERMRGSRVGVLRYWARIMRREWAEV